MVTVNGELSTDAPFGTAGHVYIRAGWPVFHLPVAQKFPPPEGRTGWRGVDLTALEVEELQRSKARLNVGIRAPVGVIGIDVDAYSGKQGGVTLAALEAELGALPPTPILTARDDGVSGQRFYRLPGDEVLTGVMGPGIEVLQRHHRYGTGAPSAHPTVKAPYRWLNPDGTEAVAVPEVSSLPMLPDAWIARFKATARKPGGSIASGGMIQLWLQNHDTHAACPRILDAVEKFGEAVTDGVARHDAMLTAQLQIVNYGAMGHLGASDGLERLREAFEDAIAGDREVGDEWYTALAGAIGIVHADPPVRTGCCPTPTGKPEFLNARNEAQAPDHFLQALSAHPPLFGTFKFGDRFVSTPRIGERGYKEPASGVDDNGPATIQPLDPLGITSFVNERVWLYDEKIVRGRVVKVRTFGSSMGWQVTTRRALNHDAIKPLTGVTHTPCLRPDGTVLDAAGWDPLSGLAYMPLAGLKVPEIPTAPTLVQAQAAAAMLLDLISEFPWQTPLDRNNFLALWVTPLILPMLAEPGPLGLVNAPMMGSGKTLLSKVLKETHGAVLRGNMPTETEEVRKQITSILTQTTAPVVIWDNVGGVLKSEHLASLATKAEWTDRILGSTTEVKVPAKRLFVMNGNNISLGGDLARRGIWCTIDPNMPRPWERTGFKYDQLDLYVARNRGEILAALLTMVRAWAAAGFARPVKRSDSFTEWFGVVGGILDACGVVGGVGETEKDQEVSGEEDSELQDFLKALWDVFADRLFTSGEAAAACVGKPSGYSEAGEALPIEIHEKLSDSAYQPARIAKSLGKYLLRNEGRWTGEGYAVRRIPRPADPTKNSWRIERSGRFPFPVSSRSAQPSPADTSSKTETSSSSSSSSRERIFETGRNGKREGPPTGVQLAFDFETCSAARLWTEEPWPGFARLLSVSDGSGSWVTSDPDRMREWLSGASELIGHNALGFDVFVAARHLGLDLEALLVKTYDTLVLSRLVEPPAAMRDENGRPNAGRLRYDLDSVGQRRVSAGKAGSVSAMATRFNRKAKLPDKYEAIPIDDHDYIAYALQDARVTWAVWQEQQQSLLDVDYAERETRLARLTARMVWHGFTVDRDLLAARVADDEAEALRLIGILEAKLGVPIGRRPGDVARAAFGEILARAGLVPELTATGKVSMTSTVLEPLTHRVDAVGELARAVRALNGDRGLPSQVVAWLGTDGAVHCSVDICRQASGRWSVTNPGLTTWGKRSVSLLRDRDLFVARPGFVLYARDLSNIDVRGMAALSQDAEMIARLQPGLPLDWHSQIADLVWGDPGRRSDAKPLAHAIDYNAGPDTIAANAGVSYDEAVRIIETLNQSFPDLLAFKQSIVAAARGGRPVGNGWGRFVNVTVNRSVTQAPGLSGQGWARDAVMECLLRMEAAGVAAYVVAHVHDEFVFELPDEGKEVLVSAIEEAMTFEKDGVPILSEGTRFARSWGDLYR